MPMPAIRSNLPCLVALVLAAAAACAGDTAQPAPLTTGGDSFFERATLTDDWFHADPAMREHGVIFSGALTQFYQGLTSGDGPKGWEYGGKLDGFLRIDGGKLGLWKGVGIPPEQVVGSSIKTKFEMRDGKPVLMRLPELNFIDDKAGKPVGINQHIRRRPIAAFGNSDGELQMLQWTAAGSGSRFCLYVHHTDAGREWVYDRQSPIGKLDKGLDEAKAKGWTVVNMKDDWKAIFPPENK